MRFLPALKDRLSGLDAQWLSICLFLAKFKEIRLLRDEAPPLSLATPPKAGLDKKRTCSMRVEPCLCTHIFQLVRELHIAVTDGTVKEGSGQQKQIKNDLHGGFTQKQHGG